jgi:hypothetical protein
MSMDVLERDDWKLLMQSREGKCVSLLLPTHRYGSQVQQDPVRLKNLLRTAETALATAGVGAGDADRMLTPMRRLLDDYPFWQHQSDGLALFAAADFFRAYRLPLPFREQVVVNNLFFVKPLLPLLATDGSFYVLALSLNQVRLLEGDRGDVRRLELPGVPANYEEALGFDQFNSGLQAHSAGPAALGRQRAGIYHGHGGGDEEHFKKDIQQYFRLVAQAIERLLPRQGAPLVLATVEAHGPLYRAVNRHPVLLDETITGNPELLSDQDLRERAWSLVESWRLRQREAALKRLRELAGKGRTASAVDEVLRAAHQGRVDVLFVGEGAEAWGSYDPATGKAEVHTQRLPDDEDLADAAAAATLAQGGEVYTVAPEAVPGHELAAVLRY